MMCVLCGPKMLTELIIVKNKKQFRLEGELVLQKHTKPGHGEQLFALGQGKRQDQRHAPFSLVLLPP